MSGRRVPKEEAEFLESTTCIIYQISDYLLLGFNCLIVL